ncbi:MAG: N-formylglutamate amidohydrolase [Polyangiaceae bacterium]
MLSAHEPPPFEIVRPHARSRFVLTCDHASHRLPEALGSLGISGADLLTHIGWDIGAALVARHLAELLDATAVLSGYSRLAIDCNRPPHVATSIPPTSGGVSIPGNTDLSPAARQARVDSLFRPYHDAIDRALDACAARLASDPESAAKQPVLLSIHSFTPELLGQKRPWSISLLYGEDTRLAHACLAELRRDPSLVVGDNEPYRVSPETDYTVPVHGVARGILHTAFEIRQDGVGTEAGARTWAERLARTIRAIDPK